MKTILKVFGGIIVLLLVLAIVLPFLFKDEIKDLVKNATNNNVNAKVEFEDADISLIKSFPNLAVSVEDLSVVGKTTFEGDTIITAKSIGVSVNIIAFLSDDLIKIKSINFDSPKIFLYVREDGKVNYNISLEDTISSEETKASEGTEAKFNIELQNYNITNGQIAYIDQTSGILVAIKNLNHSGSGDFTQDDFILDTETSIDEFTFELDGIKYLNKVNTFLDMQIAINLPNMKFILKENQLKLNNLLLKFDGSISMPEDDINIDIKYSSPRTEFRDIISLIPAIYKNDFNSLESSGKMNFAGFLKGKLGEKSLPAFNLDLEVIDGNFKYPDLPTPINNVNMTLNIDNKTGKPDNTIIDLSKIHLELGKEPIDGKLQIKKPVSGPIVDLAVKGKIDLANVKNALALDNIERLEGVINSDFKANGNIGETSGNYENINASGSVNVSNVKYLGKSGEQTIDVSSASLKFNPKNVNLSNLDMKIGDSDLKANGSLRNFISYVLSDGVLIGELDFSSNYFDFNPFMMIEDSTSAEDVETEKSNNQAAFNIPGNVNFTINSKFNKLLYDNLDLRNVNGKITVKDNKASLSNLKMNLMKGTLTGSGYYAKSALMDNPDVQFNLGINNFDIKETYDAFISVQQFAPIAKYIQGNFSSNLKMRTSLDETMMPIWETFFSNGLLNLKTAEIKNFKPFTTLGSMLNLQELSNPKLQDVKPKFEVKNGRFYVSPVSYKIGNYNVVLSGSNGIDQSIDYTMEIDVPAKKLKNQANSAISGLLGKDVDLVKTNSVKVKAFIGGTIDSPDIKTSAADVATNVVKDVTDTVVDEAKAKADQLKLEAEKKIQEEAKKKEEEIKKKLEEEAKKKLKKLFKWG